MKFNLFMIIAAVLGALFGLGFLLFPEQVMETYDVTLGEGGAWVARYLGATFIGIAALTFLARNATQSEALGALLAGDFVLSALGLIVAVLDAINGTGNSLTWSTVVIYIFLTAGFGYFRFVKPVGS